MIIQCINCKKKFEVDSALIPEEGRNIQCGACNHTWFYNSSPRNTSQTLIEKDISAQIQEIKIAEDEKNFKSVQNENKVKMKEVLNNKKVSNEIEVDDNNVKTKKIRSKFNLINILSYFLVGLISFIGIIVFLDTFKSPLINIYPGLELILYNLFESIKDIFLFTKDLFV